MTTLIFWLPNKGSMPIFFFFQFWFATSIQIIFVVKSMTTLIFDKQSMPTQKTTKMLRDSIVRAKITTMLKIKKI